MTREAGSVLLEVDGLTVDYRNGRSRNRAVRGVSLEIGQGETLGLVGESGSGKTSIGRAILGLVAASGGSIRFEGREITNLSRSVRRALAANLQVVFQDPYSSLDPTKTIGYTLTEPLRAHRPAGERSHRDVVYDMLAKVGLSRDVADRYPAQFSGGQRQRIAIARALIVSPRLVICDEPVSALDLSIQAEVMNLLMQLQNDIGLSMLFVSHDLEVVRHMSDRIVVLKSGQVVEQGNAELVYDSPQHPYTKVLLAAAPVFGSRTKYQNKQERLGLKSENLVP